MTKEEWDAWKKSDDFTKAKEQAENELKEIELIMNSTIEIDNHEQPIINLNNNEIDELCGPIRLYEIQRPSYESIPIIGTVTGCYGPDQLEKSIRFRCNNCGEAIEIESEFPYDKKVKRPIQYCSAKNGNRCKWGKLPPNVDNSTVLSRVILANSLSYFTLHLLGDQTPPNIGDSILFESTIQPRMKKGKAVIRSWWGEGTSYEVLENEE